MTPVRRLQVRARMVVLVYLTATTLLVGQSIDVVMKPPAKLNFNSAQVSIDVATDQSSVENCQKSGGVGSSSSLVCMTAPKNGTRRT